MTDSFVGLCRCVQNVDHRLAARVLLDPDAPGRVPVRSAGPAPAHHLTPSVLTVLWDRGRDPTRQGPHRLTTRPERLTSSSPGVLATRAGPISAGAIATETSQTLATSMDRVRRIETTLLAGSDPDSRTSPRLRWHEDPRERQPPDASPGYAG